MRIPIFVSSPTDLNKDQESRRDIVVSELESLQFEPRALGRTDYPTGLPLREVYSLATHCAGGIILGFKQIEVRDGVIKQGTAKEKQIEVPMAMPTPWNHLEAGILYGLALPLLVFQEDSVSGGIFDHGVADVFIHPMPKPRACDIDRDALRQIFLKWSSLARNRYYGTR